MFIIIKNTVNSVGIITLSISALFEIGSEKSLKLNLQSQRLNLFLQVLCLAS